VSRPDEAAIAPNSWARAYNLSIDPALEENARFSAANRVWIVVFGLFWVLGIIGAFLTPQD